MKSYTGRKFQKNQLQFVVEVMISSTIEFLINTIPARYMDGSHDDQWKTALEDKQKNINIPEAIWSSTCTLGCSLSIFYAKVTNEGMGEADALEICSLGTILDVWANEMVKGTKGIENGQYQCPNSEELATKWVNAAFNLPTKIK